MSRTEIIIQEALPYQASKLSEIALLAKGHWGYSREQLDSWRVEFLTITPEYIKENHVWTASVDEYTAGFAAIEHYESNAILEHLWILPDYTGRGIGKTLFLYVAERFPEFEFTSDPNANTFYEKMGAVKIGESYSVLQDKMLSVFKFTS